MSVVVKSSTFSLNKNVRMYKNDILFFFFFCLFVFFSRKTCIWFDRAQAQEEGVGGGAGGPDPQ